ncbi:response regulator transcription factor [Vreelandella populi]|uniref:LuxR family transcriptional regulator n=1 Tax=Vreelandella populi TaxID=2498858 RepID=A0A433L7T0_9GAMM|nr:helix-turn-helix transcriptional regulator [Halomonas populi]RUR43339.1 LuxR family transcriptional regulator [Halomonas populi]
MNLTPRQSQIVLLLAQGHTADQCAEALHRSVATVQRHILLARDRMQARNTTHLVALAIAQKLIHLMIVCALLVSSINPDMSAVRHRPQPRVSASRVMAHRYEGLYA